MVRRPPPERFGTGTKMSEPAGEHERTMAFAEIAFGQIKALRQAATPRNYEVWYHYATGYNPTLNKTINATLERKGNLDATDLDAMLKSKNIGQLIVCGVTTEVCVNTTVREANDRGYDCLVLEDCVASYFPEFQRVGIAMIKAQGGIFGWVAKSEQLLPVLASLAKR